MSDGGDVLLGDVLCRTQDRAVSLESTDEVYVHQDGRFLHLLAGALNTAHSIGSAEPACCM